MQMKMVASRTYQLKSFNLHMESLILYVSVRTYSFIADYLLRN